MLIISFTSIQLQRRAGHENWIDRSTYSGKFFLLLISVSSITQINVCTIKVPHHDMFLAL